MKAIKNNGKKYFSLNITNEVINLIANLLVNFANVTIPLAIGSYGLEASRSESWTNNNETLIIDEEEMKALIYSYDKGQNYLGTSYIYAGGQTMKFISEFLKRVDISKLFIKVKIENYIEKVSDIEEQLNKIMSEILRKKEEKRVVIDTVDRK